MGRYPPQALRWTKGLLREAQHDRLDSILELSATYQALAHHADDHTEALAALFEKRAPRFHGRLRRFDASEIKCCHSRSDI